MKPPRKKKPLTLTAYAEHRGVSQPTVTRAVQTGRLKESVARGANGDPVIVDAELADLEWNANTDATKVRAQGDGDADGDENLVEATTRLKVAQADTAELKLQRERGELVRAADVEKALVDAFGAARSSLMILPQQLKLDLPHLTQADVDRIDARVREALEGLAVRAS